MPNSQMLKFIFAGLIGIALSSAACAISLGKGNLVSSPGEPLRIEVPIELAAEEQSLLSTLSATIPPLSAMSDLAFPPKFWTSMLK